MESHALSLGTACFWLSSFAVDLRYGTSYIRTQSMQYFFITCNAFLWGKTLVPLWYLLSFLDAVFIILSLAAVSLSLSRSPVARHHTQLFKEFQMCPFGAHITLSACTQPGMKGRGTTGDSGRLRQREILLQGGKKDAPCGESYFPLGLVQNFKARLRSCSCKSSRLLLFVWEKPAPCVSGFVYST